MDKEEVPSVNPKLDAMCEMLKTIHDLNERNKMLEAQIEKMKCCEMCKHKNLNWNFSPICEARDEIKIENPLTCKCDKWEIKENER